MHVNFNGVVPEIAARAHCEKIDICTKEALKKASLSIKDIEKEYSNLQFTFTDIEDLDITCATQVSNFFRNKSFDFSTLQSMNFSLFVT